MAPIYRAIWWGTLLSAAACGGPRATRDQLMERVQLRREIAGLHSLAPLLRSGGITDSTVVLVSLSDTLFRALLDSTLPVEVPLAGGITVRLDHATVAFRGNVARIDVTGRATRAAFPSISAGVQLRGALDSLIVDSAQVLRARLSLDDVEVIAPDGVPGAWRVLRAIVRQGLPEITASFPSVAVPVRLDRLVRLPAFGPEGPVSVPAAQADVRVSTTRVIAFRDRLWVILKVDRSPFRAVSAGNGAARGESQAGAALRRVNAP